MPQNGETETLDAGILDQSIDATVSNITQEMAAIRMEKQMIMSECRARPRNMERIKASLLETLKAFPALADEAIYCKPVGKDRESRKEKYVEGLSIRAAETIAEAYGYNEISIQVTDLPDDKAQVTARMFDYQTVRIWSDSGILSKWYKGYDGRQVKMSDDRFYSIICKADASKRVRECILRTVNAGLKAWFLDTCYKILERSLNPEVIDKLAEEFKQLGATPANMEFFVGRPRSLGWTAVDYRKLCGIRNAIRDGESTLKEFIATEERSRVDPSKSKADQLADHLAGKSNSNGHGAKAGEPPFNPPTEGEQAEAREIIRQQDEAAAQSQEQNPTNVASADDAEIMDQWKLAVEEAADVTACNALEQKLSQAPERLRGSILEMVLARRQTIRGRRGARQA